MTATTTTIVSYPAAGELALDAVLLVVAVVAFASSVIFMYFAVSNRVGLSIALLSQFILLSICVAIWAARLVVPAAVVSADTGVSISYRVNEVSNIYLLVVVSIGIVMLATAAYKALEEGLKEYF